jgi:hypothetical protein
VAATRIRQLIDAPRERVYRALVDPVAVARWKVPAGMTCDVHVFDAREGGAVRISLTYDAPDRAGKTSGRTDTYRGRFVRLVPGELVVEAGVAEARRLLDTAYGAHVDHAGRRGGAPLPRAVPPPMARRPGRGDRLGAVSASRWSARWRPSATRR